MILTSAILTYGVLDVLGAAAIGAYRMLVGFVLGAVTNIAGHDVIGVLFNFLIVIFGYVVGATALFAYGVLGCFVIGALANVASCSFFMLLG